MHSYLVSLQDLVQYWPDDGKADEYGPMIVTHDGTVSAKNICMRGLRFRYKESVSTKHLGPDTLHTVIIVVLK